MQAVSYMYRTSIRKKKTQLLAKFMTDQYRSEPNISAYYSILQFLTTILPTF